ncbi:hypothetical protein L218DRAFT_1007368 [Marasmius fiardii PR-910]|nr:hypothetical protein L218DRAFT_1007368 [Marasmius fiardii PR-910]
MNNNQGADESKSLADRSSTIHLINGLPSANLQLNTHENIHGEWVTTPSGYITHGDTDTSKIRDKFGKCLLQGKASSFYGSQGKVIYKIGGSQKLLFIEFYCPFSDSDENSITARSGDETIKVDKQYNKTGPLEGTVKVTQV